MFECSSFAAWFLCQKEPHLSYPSQSYDDSRLLSRGIEHPPSILMTLEQDQCDSVLWFVFESRPFRRSRSLVGTMFECSTLLLFVAPILLITVLYAMIGVKLRLTAPKAGAGRTRAATYIQRRTSLRTLARDRGYIVSCASFIWPPCSRANLVCCWLSMNDTSLGHQSRDEALVDGCHFLR